MIEIQDLQDLDKLKIIDLIVAEKERPIEIYVPKETQKYFSVSSAIAIEYAQLAYIGQLLHDISAVFNFEEITPEDHESIRFELNGFNTEKLAETLLFISYCYVNDNIEDEEFEFYEYVDIYIDEVENGKLKPACPYFIEVYNDFLKQGETD